MTRPDTRPRRRVVWAIGALIAVVALIAVAASWRPWTAPAATVAAGADEPVGVALPERLDLPDDATVLVFGDSWTYGSAAAAPTLGYAYVLAELTGYTTVVDGVRGSGYLKPGLDGPDFGTRIAALDPALDPDLVIVQGSINDRRLPATGYADAVSAAWDRLAATYPRARILILGPAPQVLPVEPATARIDRDLQTLAADRGWWYVSPVQDDWITPANYADVIDTGIGRDHPSTPGHRYLAERVAAAIAAASR
ncbi:SGNH/GDSL hydrolase family protein [Microbacterium sp. W1N]|uniref:SGNH/GDSL hydrolase family protein n=1 Tax=Microbacterium festucae TaxID=2977531 RepID=UPI0021C0A45C|nr:SGNH/GDSL hydrolase family protein [Microbacterium festucae]MCT9818670.1 SGNH/GDSL hydrolase family protein [Microbacterium festucae]